MDNGKFNNNTEYIVSLAFLVIVTAIDIGVISVYYTPLFFGLELYQLITLILIPVALVIIYRKADKPNFWIFGTYAVVQPEIAHLFIIRLRSGWDYDDFGYATALLRLISPMLYIVEIILFSIIVLWFFNSRKVTFGQFFGLKKFFLPKDLEDGTIISSVQKVIEPFVVSIGWVLTIGYFLYSAQ